MVRKVLVIFAHPAIRRSRINAALIASARDLPNVTVHDLYETYPDFSIDVEREQALLNDHDVIVFQHPLFWYSAPAIIKEWQDLVLELGYAYGRNGHQLAGKGWMQAITTGAQAAAYQPDGINRYSIHELLRPFEATAHLCQMHWLPPFVVHAAHFAETNEIKAEAARYQAHLLALTGMEAMSPALSLPASPSSDAKVN